MALFLQEIPQVRKQFYSSGQFIVRMFLIVTEKTSTTTIAPNVTNVYWSFDSNAPAVTGKSGQGLLFSGISTSYLIVPGFQQVIV